MSRRNWMLLVGVLFICDISLVSYWLSYALSDQKENPRAPFSAIRWESGCPHVLVNDTWYELIAINDHTVEQIEAFCRKRYGAFWQKRFDEDIEEVLAGMGRAPGDDVRLVVRDKNENTRTLDKVSMTAEKRRAVMQAKYAGQVAPKPVRPASRTLTRKQIARDLDQLAKLLKTRYAYLKRRDIPLDDAINAIRSRFPDGAPAAEFAVAVHQLLCRFGDGHTGVDVIEQYLPSTYLPFLVGQSGNKLIAFREDRSGFLDTDHPCLVSIDGVAIDKWLKKAGELAADGSPQWTRHAAIRNLRLLGHLRRELNLPDSASLRVVLDSVDGANRNTLELAVSPQKPIHGEWPRTKDRLLPGNIGYLRIAKMDDDPAFLRRVEASMREFNDTDGLIIDVRGNTGGSRDSLRTIFPMLMTPGERPVVANIAAYRLDQSDPPDRPDGYLADRFLYPQSWSRWSPDARAAIDQAAIAFKPEWTPPKADFSAWHYIVLDRPASLRLPAYKEPVVVLLDGACFSATDIFLAALKGRPNVTLMGMPSGGGSGRAMPFRLPESGIKLRLSSMASFRPDGRLYDGAGIDPDVLIEPAPDDLIGKGDSVLEAAQKHINAGAVSDGDE